MSLMGERLREKRKEKDFTMEELGKIIGVNKTAISKWERGEVTNIKQKTILDLADTLDCSPSWLMGYDNTPEQEASDIASQILKKCNYERLGVVKEIAFLSDEDFESFMDFYQLYKKSR